MGNSYRDLILDACGRTGANPGMDIYQLVEKPDGHIVLARNSGEEPFAATLLCLFLSLFCLGVVLVQDSYIPRIVSAVVLVLSLSCAFWKWKQIPLWCRKWEFEPIDGKATLIIRESADSIQTVIVGEISAVAVRELHMPARAPRRWSVLVWGTLGHIEIVGFLDPEVACGIAHKLGMKFVVPIKDRSQLDAALADNSVPLLSG